MQVFVRYSTELTASVAEVKKKNLIRSQAFPKNLNLFFSLFNAMENSIRREVAQSNVP